MDVRVDLDGVVGSGDGAEGLLDDADGLAGVGEEDGAGVEVERGLGGRLEDDESRNASVVVQDLDDAAGGGEAVVLVPGDGGPVDLDELGRRGDGGFHGGDFVLQVVEVVLDHVVEFGSLRGGGKGRSIF